MKLVNVMKFLFIDSMPNHVDKIYIVWNEKTSRTYAHQKIQGWLQITPDFLVRWLDPILYKLK